MQLGSDPCGVTAADPREGAVLCVSHILSKDSRNRQQRIDSKQTEKKYNLFLDWLILRCLVRYIGFSLSFQT